MTNPLRFEELRAVLHQRVAQWPDGRNGRNTVVINRECSTPVFLSKQCLYSICYEADTRQPAFLV